MAGCEAAVNYFAIKQRAMADAPSEIVYRARMAIRKYPVMADIVER